MRWFTADLHLGHANIIEYCERPYASVAEMDAALLANWAAMVAPDDDVWVLGDVALGRIAESLPPVAGLPGHKHLVPGNHDRCWSGQRRIRPQDVAIYTDVGFEIHPGTVRLQIAGADVLACHFPVAGDSQDADRFTDYRPELPPDGWLLHGHVHTRWRTNGRQINVGVDVWDFRPVAESEVIGLMRPAEGLPGPGR